jgi:DNA-binding winged helix-turn-helix (wHTH) protein
MDSSATAFSGARVRADELQYIIDCLQQGQCCSVVGPSNIGKSSLLKSLLTEEVHQQYKQKGIEAPVMIFVDCLAVGNSEQAFYELLLRRLVDELEGAAISSSTFDALKDLHNEVLRGRITDSTAQSLYASSLHRLRREERIRLVFILDEFDDVFRILTPLPFRQLRVLHDALRAKLCYITGTSHHLDRLRSGWETYEFRELFHRRILVLRPLLKEDAGRLVAYLRDQGIILNEKHIPLAVKLSGGHPGLLRQTCDILSTSNFEFVVPLESIITELSAKHSIQEECRRLWNELEEEEREGLFVLIRSGQPALDTDQLQALNGKGLVKLGENNAIAVFSPIFGAFVQRELKHQTEARIEGVYCDLEMRHIWVDGEEMTLKLSEQQRKLILFLYQKYGTVCTYDEIAKGVWGVGEGVSPGAIHELVKRVRQKIEPDWKKPRYIVTVVGEGYRLQAPNPGHPTAIR